MNKELLQELNDCQGSIDNREYNAADKLSLEKMQEEGLVRLCWNITPKGKEALKHE